MNDTLITLQEMVAHQGREMAALSDELYQQQKEVAALKAELAILRSTVKALKHDDSGIRHPHEETPPPHY